VRSDSAATAVPDEAWTSCLASVDLALDRDLLVELLVGFFM
jgi:hypothetical protein